MFRTTLNAQVVGLIKSIVHLGTGSWMNSFQCGNQAILSLHTKRGLKKFCQSRFGSFSRPFHSQNDQKIIPYYFYFITAPTHEGIDRVNNYVQTGCRWPAPNSVPSMRSFSHLHSQQSVLFVVF